MSSVRSYQILEGGIGMSFTKDPFNGLFFVDFSPAPGTQASELGVDAGDCILGINSRRFAVDDELADVAAMLRSTPRPMTLTVRKSERAKSKKREEDKERGDSREQGRHNQVRGSREGSKSPRGSSRSSASHGSSGSPSSRDDGGGRGELGYNHYRWDSRDDFDEEEAWASRGGETVRRSSKRREQAQEGREEPLKDDRQRSLSAGPRGPRSSSGEPRGRAERSSSAGRRRRQSGGSGSRQRSHSEMDQENNVNQHEISTQSHGSSADGDAVEVGGGSSHFQQRDDQNKPVASNRWFKLSVSERFSRTKRLDGDKSEDTNLRIGAAIRSEEKIDDVPRDDGGQQDDEDAKKKRRSILSKALKLTGLKPSRDNHQAMSGPGAWNHLQDKEKSTVNGSPGVAEQLSPGAESIASARRRDSSMRDSFGFRSSIEDSHPAIALNSQDENMASGTSSLGEAVKEESDVLERRAALRAKRVSSRQSKMVSDEVQRQRLPWMDTLYSQDADRAEAERLRGAMQRHKNAKQSKQANKQAARGESDEPASASFAGDDSGRGEVGFRPKPKLDAEEEAVLAKIKAGRDSGHLGKGRTASLSAAQIREQHNALTKDKSGGEGANFDKAFLAEMHSQKVTLERQHKRKMLRERRNSRANRSLGIGANESGDAEPHDTTHDDPGEASADWSEGPWVSKGIEKKAGGGGGRGEGGSRNPRFSLTSSSKRMQKEGEAKGGGFEEVSASVVVEESGDDAVRAYEAALAKAQLAKERVDARRLSSSGRSSFAQEPKATAAAPLRSKRGESTGVRPSLSAAETQRMHAQLDAKAHRNSRMRNDDDDTGSKGGKGGGLRKSTDREKSREHSRGHERGRTSSRGRSSSAPHRRTNSGHRTSADSEEGSQRGRTSAGTDRRAEKRSSQSRGRSSSRTKKNAGKIDYYSGLGGPGGGGSRRVDHLAHPRSASGIMLADDLFNSSEEDFHEPERKQMQRNGGRSGRSKSRGRRRSSPENDPSTKGMVRVDSGVKPITATVATVADSILDFFS